MLMLVVCAIFVVHKLNASTLVVPKCFLLWHVPSNDLWIVYHWGARWNSGLWLGKLFDGHWGKSRSLPWLFLLIPFV